MTEQQFSAIRRSEQLGGAGRGPLAKRSARSPGALQATPRASHRRRVHHALSVSRRRNRGAGRDAGAVRNRRSCRGCLAEACLREAADEAQPSRCHADCVLGRCSDSSRRRPTERQEDGRSGAGSTACAEPEPEPFVDTIARPRPKRKVIAFPRHLSVAPETVYRLADPVTAEVPRILDVPEELEAIPTTPFLDGLQLDLLKPADVARDREHVELPFRAVRISQRVFAGLIDVAVTGCRRGSIRALSPSNPRQTAAHQASDSGYWRPRQSCCGARTSTCLSFTPERPSA